MKESMTRQTSFFMLLQKSPNQFLGSLIKIWSKASTLIIFSFNLTFMDMVVLNASVTNQWPLDWFKTQVVTTKKQVNVCNKHMPCEKRGRHPMTLRPICLP